MDFEENNQAQPTAPDNNSDQGESFEEMLEASFDYAPPRRGEIRKATILQIEPNEIIVDLGAKQDGLVTSQDLERLTREFRSALEIGQEVPVYVLNPRDSDGNLVVSINMGLQQYDWDEAHKLMDNDEVVEVVVSGYNRGGILVRWHMLEGFIPSSHMVTISAGLQGNERREALNELIGEEVGVKVIEVDQDRRRLIFSEREAQREWRAQQKARLLSTLNEGDVVHGTVTGLRDFGAFVNLGGADGLIHVSELAWHRVDHPRDVLRVGQEIDVYVLNLDLDRNRIALSRKRLLPDPWDSALEQYHEGMQVEGVVTNVVDFGAFIALDDGLEGLLHLSEMGDGTLKEPYSYVKKGDRLQLRISRLEPEQRRVGFTQRWGTEQPILARADEDEEEALGEEFEEADADEIAAGADVEPEAAIEPADEEQVEAEEAPVEEDEPLDEEPAAAEADVEPADEEPVEAIEPAAAEADVEPADEEPVEAVEAEEEPVEEDE
ncbi:MAG: S1 RNA-binding domain-containing protein, partial [Anaerolineae bacterium]|nr:S1 RNA-binding domain-containing protein [Anaerolineae bacterium]